MAQSTRLHGQFAKASIQGVTVDMFEWEVSYETKVVDTTAHGDYWEQPIGTVSRWRFRAKKYILGNVAATVLSDGWNSAATPGVATIIAYSGGTGTAVIFTGTGLPVRASISAPNTMVEAEIEFQGVGAPTVGV